MDNSRKKNVLFSWQRHDKNIINEKIQQSKLLAIKSVNLDFEKLFLYDIFSELSTVIQMEKNAFNLPFFPFYESLNEYYKYNFESFSFKSLLSNLVVDLTQSETLKYIIENIDNRDFILDEKTQGIVNTLVKLISFKGNVYLVCKYPHLFDEYSKQLLKYIQNYKFIEEYPKLKNLTLVYLSDNFDDIFYNDINDVFEIKEPQEENIVEIFHVFGKDNLEKDFQKAIFQLCDGNLKKMEYFINNITNETAIGFTQQKFENAINVILSNKLRAIGDHSRDVLRVLSTASELGEIIDLLPLIKVIDHDRSFVEDTLEISEKYNLTIKDSDTVKFANIFVRQYFERLTKYKRVINKKISDAYSELYPSNYEVRLFFLEKSSSEMLSEACDLLILIWLNYKKNGIKCPTELELKLDKYAYKFHRIEYLKTMEIFFLNFKNQNFENSVSILNTYSEIDSPLLMLVKDYYVGLAYYKLSRNNEDLDNALLYMKDVQLRSKDLSIALYETSSLTLISFIINITGDYGAAQRIERELIYNISNRIEYDYSAKDNLHRIYRKYAALHPIELAVQKTEKSIIYFEKTPLINEYYMAVINHIGNLLNLGENDVALSFAKLLYCHLDVFYCSNNKKMIIYSLNNILIAFFRAGMIIPKELLTQYTNILDSISESPTKIIPYITIAIISYEKFNDKLYSISLLDKAEKLNKPIADSYYEYYILINKAALLYLDIENRQKGIFIIESLKDCCPGLYRGTIRSCLIERTQIILENMKKGKDKVAIEDELRKTNHRYKIFMNYFLFSDIQFWSE